MIGYNTEQDLIDYAAARGIVLSRPPGVLLTLAMDWLEIQAFRGSKTDPEQILEFPRNGDTVVPERIKTAQLVAAIIYDGGGDPLAAIGPRVTQETVFGAVSVSYSDSGPLSTFYPQLTALLRPYLGGGGGSFFEVRRG